MFRSIRTQLLSVQILSLLLMLCVGLFSINQVQKLSMESSRSYAMGAASQARSTVESILDTVRISTRSFCYSAAVQELLLTDENNLLRLATIYRKFSDSVSYAINNNSNIVDICLVTNEGEVYVYGSQASKVLPHILALYETNGSGDYFTGFLGENSDGGTEYYAYVLPVNSATPGVAFSQQVGLCVVLCRTSAILKVLEAAVVENTDVLISYNDDTQTLRLKSTDAMALADAEVNSYAIDSVDWNLVQYLDPSAMFGGNRSTLGLLFAYLVIAIFGVGIFLYSTYVSILQPIVQINSQLLQNAQHPDDASVIYVTSKNELESIAVEINRMLKRMRENNQRSIETQQRLYNAELLQRRMQFSALQSQINPHFLYNTLSCIRGIALENGQDEIASVAVKMSKIFRYSIKGNSYVQVKEELGIIRRYVEIMNLRMNDKFKMQLEVPEEVQNCWMTKMVLQPIVENAIFHGLEGVSRNGELSIQGRIVDEDSFVIEVHDNGTGISGDKLSNIRYLMHSTNADAGINAALDSDMGIGLININQKIRLLLGEHYGLKVDSLPGQGTTVSVFLPLLYKKPAA